MIIHTATGHEIVQTTKLAGRRAGDGAGDTRAIVKTTGKHGGRAGGERARHARLRIPRSIVSIGWTADRTGDSVRVDELREAGEMHRWRGVRVNIGNGVGYRPRWKRWCRDKAFVLEVRNQASDPASALL